MDAIAATSTRTRTAGVALLVLAAFLGRASPREDPPARLYAPIGSPPPTLRVDFETATVAFYMRARSDGWPIKLDDRPCRAVGEPWREAEAAVVDGLDRAHVTAKLLAYWPSLQDLGKLVVRRERLDNWRDALRALARRRRDRSLVDASLEVTAAGGYLVMVSPNGVQAYCFAVERSGRRISLVPRLVEMIDL